MALTQDDRLAEKLRSLRNHGASVSDLARHESKRSFVMADYPMVGFNYRMTDLQGALGAVQMARLPGILDRRRELAAAYDRALADIRWIRTPRACEGCVHGYQSYVCLFVPEEPTMENVDRLRRSRDQLMAALEDQGIATRQGTQAVHACTFYRERYGLEPSSFPNAYIADCLSLALPLYPQMTCEEQGYVVEKLKSSGPTR